MANQVVDMAMLEGQPSFVAKGIATEAIAQLYGVNVPFLYPCQAALQIGYRPSISHCSVKDAITKINNNYLSGFESRLERQADIIEDVWDDMDKAQYERSPEIYIQKCLAFADAVLRIYEIVEARYENMQKELRPAIKWGYQQTNKTESPSHWLENAVKALGSVSMAYLDLENYSLAGSYLERAFELQRAAGMIPSILEQWRARKIIAVAMAVHPSVPLKDAASAAYHWVRNYRINEEDHNNWLAVNTKLQDDYLNGLRPQVEAEIIVEWHRWKFAHHFALATQHVMPTLGGVRFMKGAVQQGFVVALVRQSVLGMTTNGLAGLDDVVEPRTNVEELVCQTNLLPCKLGQGIQFSKLAWNTPKIRRDILNDALSVYSSMTDSFQLAQDATAFMNQAGKSSKELGDVQQQLYEVIRGIIPDSLDITDPCIMGNIEIIERMLDKIAFLQHHWAFFKEPCNDVIDIISQEIVIYFETTKKTSHKYDDVKASIYNSTKDNVKQRMSQAGFVKLVGEFQELCKTTSKFLEEVKQFINELKALYPKK